MHKMYMEIVGNTREKFDMKTKYVIDVDIGGFAFYIEPYELYSFSNTLLPFDFEAFNISTSQNEDETVKIRYNSGEGLTYNSFEIDKESYIDMYKDIDIDIEDVDAKMLSSVAHIFELYYNIEMNKVIYDMDIESITFYDMENNCEYKVDKRVIDKFNKEQ